MSLLELLGKGVEILTSFLPRPRLVPRTHRLVVWILGFRPRALYGLLVVWPLVESAEEYDLREDATAFDPTTLWTKDGREVSISAVLTWAIHDPVLVAESVNDVSEWVGEKIESILPKIVGAYTLAELQRKAAGGEGREWALNRHLVTEAKAMLEPYGISVADARIKMTAESVTLRIIGAEGSKGGQQ